MRRTTAGACARKVQGIQIRSAIAVRPRERRDIGPIAGLSGTAAGCEDLAMRLERRLRIDAAYPLHACAHADEPGAPPRHRKPNCLRSHS